MKILKNFTLLSIVLSLIIFCGLFEANENLAQNIVRLHVIGETDGVKDQMLKLKVRDAILEKAVETKTTKGNVILKLDDFKKVSEAVLSENGSKALVTVEYGNFSFPTKHYENISLPAGKYDAVRVKIGKAQGKNWWCVLFPPLCFVDASTDSESSNMQMKNMISKENYDLITASSRGGGIPVEIKFKLFEIYSRFRRGDKVYAKIGKD